MKKRLKEYKSQSRGQGDQNERVKKSTGHDRTATLMNSPSAVGVIYTRLIQLIFQYRVGVHQLSLLAKELQTVVTSEGGQSVFFKHVAPGRLTIIW